MYVEPRAGALRGLERLILSHLPESKFAIPKTQLQNTLNFDAISTDLQRALKRIQYKCTVYVTNLLALLELEELCLL